MRLGLLGWASAPDCGWFDVWGDAARSVHWLAYDEWMAMPVIEGEQILLWSVGAFALPKLRTSGKVLLLQPAVNFSGPGGWSPRVAERMLERLRLDKQGCIAGFAAGLGLTGPAFDVFVETGVRMPSDVLALGLESLKIAVPSYRGKARVEAWLSDGDAVCRPKPITAWAQGEGLSVRRFSGARHGPGGADLDEAVRAWWESE
jgi:hypothetical protein